MGNKANGIKAEKKQEIIEAVGLMEGINPPKDKLFFLMEEYNKALGQGSHRYRKQDLLSCGDCRKAVVHFWRNIRAIWNKTA